MKIIDAHNHPDWHGHNLERFIANMDQYGISKTWLFRNANGTNIRNRRRP